MKYITFNEVLGTYRSKEAGIKALAKYGYWFPVPLTPRVAGIVADLMGDGHLQHPPMWRMDYTSASVDELQRFNQEIKDLFGFSGYVRPCTTNAWGKSYLLAVSCKPLGRVMSLCGVPPGAKVLTPFNIPLWITEDKECFRRFIMRLFDCEGTVDKDIGLELRMWKEQSLLEKGIHFFENIKSNLLIHFDIKTTNVFLGGKNLRKDGKETREMKLKVRKHSEVIKFAQEIGFEDKVKQERLQSIVSKILSLQKYKKDGNGGI